MKRFHRPKLPALLALSFGIGVLLSFFLPPTVLAVLLTLVIVTAAVLSVFQC